MANDSLEDSRYSLSHAKNRIAEFEAEAAAFNKSNPYKGCVERHANGVSNVIKIKLISPLPLGLRGIAFDAANNLRAALDQCGFASAVGAGRSGKFAHFPFAANAADMSGKIAGYARGKARSHEIPKEIFDLMTALQPYKGGNDLLWALNELSNTHKHEIVIPVVMATGAKQVEIAPKASSSFLILPERYGQSSVNFTMQWDRRKNELVVAEVRGNPQADFDVKIQTFIAIGKVDVVKGKPAIEVLNQMASMVDGIVSAVEAEGRRIGIFQ